MSQQNSECRTKAVVVIEIKNYSILWS